ncbi:MAG: potassium transporter TrkG [bacterium]|nr:potassium transporter TrkG [bacterium]
MNIFKNMSSVQSLLTGFMVIIAAGTCMLMLPAASSDGVSQPFVDALFTAASAVTTTGLIVVDTGGFYTTFGEIVILVLFQIGGLGYITIIVLMVYFFGKRPSLRNGITMQEAMVGISMGDMKRFVKYIFLYTLIFELSGALCLGIYWMEDFGLAHAAYLGLFYSVSAFCTAGFGLMPDSLASYSGSMLVNMVINIVSIAGGLGFFVLNDIHSYLGRILKQASPNRLLMHTRLVVSLSFILMAAGTAFLVFSGPGGDSTVRQNFLEGSFQAISASTTTGFNTVDIGGMSRAALFMIMLLMFIGAAPAGSGGGVKVTTAGLMMASLFSVLKGRESVEIFKRRVSPDIVNKAFVVAFMALIVLTADMLILSLTEEAGFQEILFEVMSALGTVGLSTGITPSLTVAGKIVLSVTMLIGRLGPLAIGYSLFKKSSRASFEYAEEEVYIG